MAQVAATTLDGSTAATLHVDSDYGRALSQAFVDAFEHEQGGSVQTQVAFASGRSSYTARLSEALAGEPDILILVGFPESGRVILRDFYANYAAGSVDIMVSNGFQDPSLPDDVGHPLDNVIGTAPLPAGPANDAFISQYTDAYGREPGVFNAHAYDATSVLMLASAAAGESDGTAIRDTIHTVANPGGTVIDPTNLAEGLQMAHAGEDIQYVGASSNAIFDDNGDMAAFTYEIWQFGAGSNGITQVDTIEFRK